MSGKKGPKSPEHRAKLVEHLRRIRSERSISERAEMAAKKKRTWATKARPIRIEGDVAHVPLTKGNEAIVDAADVPLVDGKCWVFRMKGNVAYAISRGRQMHRVIADANSGQEVDHRDGDGLNNRRSNLRIATKSQNGGNRRKNRGCVTRFKGVRYDRSIRTAAKISWQAVIQVNKRRFFLGCFATEEEAALAYDRAAVEHFGEFAKLNFPLESSNKSSP